jgi:iron complex transport system substrate-binding protein
MSRRAFLAVALGAALTVRSAGAAEAPSRILPLGGSTTETVFALGAGDRVVGVDQTSVFPPAARTRPQVGYVRALSAEGILSLKPDLVLAAPEAGPGTTLEQLASAGVHIERLPPGFTVAAAVDRIIVIGAAVGRRERAALLAHAVAADVQQVTAEVGTLKTRPRVLFLLNTGRGALLVSGRGTAANAMIDLAGGVNAIDAFDGYKPLAGEAMVAMAPDYLLMMGEGVDALGGQQAVLARRDIAMLRAAREGRLISFEALYLLGFGPRIASALRDLAAALHPEHRFAPLPERQWSARW